MAKLLAIGLAVACACSTLASAQQSKSDQPSKYVWYGTARINAGKFPVYTSIVSQFRDAVNSTAPDIYWIAGSPITGNSDRITYVTFHDNMASVEKMMNAFDKVDRVIYKNAGFTAQAAEAGGESHWVLAEYNKEMSYRPDMVPLSHTTWWASELVSLKPGCEDELKDIAKQVIDLHKKAGDNEHWIAYDIRAGYPEPSVLFVTAMRSLAEGDQEPPAAAKEAFENPLVKQAFSRFDKGCVTHVESTYTRVEPGLSRPPQSLVAANPDFWTIKEEAPVVATKSKAKKGAVEPAALKEKEKH
jgi:hypothetical protein